MGEVWYIENTWTCTTCQYKNKGRHMDCQNCGARREAGVQDEMPADLDAAPRVTDPEQLRQATAGAHWECEFCGGQTRDLHGNCQNCGGDREEPTYNEPYHFESHTPPPMKSYPISELKRPEPEPPLTWWQLHKRKVFIGGGIAAGVGALTWLLMFIFMPKEVHASVTYTEWRYKEELRQRVTKHGSGWRSNMPSSSFDESCHQRQRGTERCNPYKCNPHQESYRCDPYQCNCQTTCTSQSNGYSKCSKSCSTCYRSCNRTVYDTCYKQCPVYEDWCTYKYYEWPIIKEKVTMGYDHKVYWPELKKTGPNQRVDRYQGYKVKFERQPDRWEYKPRNLGDYKRFKQKDPWLIKVNRAGMVWPQRKLPLEA